MDYRKGMRPTRRRVESEEAIRKALTDRKRTFSNLLKDTRLSRSALAFHLKELHKGNEVKREPDSKDFRVTYYSLTSKGRDEFHRQKDIETLDSAEALFSPEIIADLAGAVSKFLEPSMRQYLLQSEEEEFKILEQCITFSIYSDKPIRNSVLMNQVSQLARLAISSMLSECVTSPENIEKIPELTLVFRFHKDKFKEYQKLRKRKDRTEKETVESPQRLPDIHDYVKSKQRD